tara:strand:- start:258 stop:578 length:321 start_codon:yes stop_codon:yes gene_type:complete
MDSLITEGIVGLLAAVAAYFSIRAKIEAGQANRAVNHSEEGSPRLYDIALSNSTSLAAIRERVKNVERNCEQLSAGQAEHREQLRQHSEKITSQTIKLEQYKSKEA